MSLICGLNPGQSRRPYATIPRMSVTLQATKHRPSAVHHMTATITQSGLPTDTRNTTYSSWIAAAGAPLRRNGRRAHIELHQDEQGSCRRASRGDPADRV
jgi:hypothetical protein